MARIQKQILLWMLVPALLFGCAPRQEATAPAEETPENTQAPAVIEIVTEETPTPDAPPQATETPLPGSVDASAPVFSIAWVSDTQHYSELYPDYLTSMTQWVSDHRQAYNIRAFVHTGDMVNRSGSARQWENLTSALTLLGDIPLLAVTGNHDVGTKTIDYSYFEKYIASNWYTDDAMKFENGRGYAQRIDLGSVAFLLIGTGWGYSDESVAWLNETIRRYPNDIVILCVHSYIDTNTHLTDGGKILFEQVVKPNLGVRVVLCGHRDDIAFRTDELDLNQDGAVERRVYTMMYNYQEVKKDGGGGYLRLLTVDTGKRTMEVKTYSPYFDAYKTGENEQFTIERLY